MVYMLMFMLFSVGFSNEVEKIMSKNVFPQLSKVGGDIQQQPLGYVKVGKRGYVFYEDQGKLKRVSFGSGILDIRGGKMYIKEDGKIKVEEFRFARRGATTNAQQPQNLPPLKELLEGGKSN
ncbi:hypothetical protein [Hydrogenobacter thermophilus]|uniref:hypothetical protein n=1 Tax=Hydrogenobacter thermophilus TaxID=940 RepID=UPI0030FC2647